MLKNIEGRKTQDDHEKKPRDELIKLSNIENQKYLIQRRGRHVVTFPYEPELKDLIKYGPGTYTVMFTKPSFSFCKSTTVPIPKEKIKFQTKQPLPKTQTPPKKRIESIPMPLEETKEPPPPPPPKPKSISSQPQTSIVKESPKPVYEPPPKACKLKINRCHHCRDTMGFNGNYISRYVKICEFCDDIFCSRKCYLDHKCQGSYTCFHCRNRFPIDYYIRNRFCGKLFCTLQCTYQCQDKNESKDECCGCEDFIEEYEDGELIETNFKRRKPEIICTNCKSSFEDFDPGIFCPDCDKDEDFFCSWECFNEVHDELGEYHRGIKIEDLPDP